MEVSYCHCGLRVLIQLPVKVLHVEPWSWHPNMFSSPREASKHGNVMRVVIPKPAKESGEHAMAACLFLDIQYVNVLCSPMSAQISLSKGDAERNLSRLSLSLFLLLLVNLL